MYEKDMVDYAAVYVAMMKFSPFLLKMRLYTVRKETEKEVKRKRRYNEQRGLDVFFSFRY